MSVQRGRLCRHTSLVLVTIVSGLVTAAAATIAVLFYASPETAERPIGGLAIVAAALWAVATIWSWARAYLERTKACALFHDLRSRLAWALMPPCWRSSLDFGMTFRAAVQAHGNHNVAAMDQADEDLKRFGFIAVHRDGSDLL